MRIDGVPNRRACMEPCREGLTIDGQNAYPSPDLDALEVVDWLFPEGMNHHTLMTGSSVLNAVTNKVVRQLSGLGELPERAPQGVQPPVRAQPDVLVVGAGPAGLAAATAAAERGARTILIDERMAAGGSLRCDPRFGPEFVAERVERAERAGVDIRLGHTAIGYYPEDREPLLAVASAERMTLFAARRTVYATGAYPSNRAFVNNDRPGVVAGRAVGRLLLDHGIEPGGRICVVGDRGDAFGEALVAGLVRADIEVLVALAPDVEMLGVHGRSWVTGVDVQVAGHRQRWDCDLVAVVATPSPASELPRQHGCDVSFDLAGGGFAVAVDHAGQSGVAGVFACGDVCGYRGPQAAAAMGELVGRQAAG